MPESAQETFRTHFHYLRAFATMCGHIYGRVLWKLLEERAAEIESGLMQFPVAGDPDLGQLERSLSNAWGTELLLASTYEWVDQDDLLRIHNSWAIVQAYYVQYHAIQALRVAQGYERPESHPKSQALFADTWAGRVTHQPPCSLGYGNQGPMNVPAGITIDDRKHAWSSVDKETCWSLAVKALRTTREEKVAERKKARRELKQRDRRKAWKAEEEARLKVGKRPRKEPEFRLPRLTQSEHASVEQSVRNFTVMDYLYRLRVKANYIDSVVFLEGPDDEEVSRRVLQELKDISAHVMLLHELNIRAVIGKQEMHRIADEWISPRTSSPKVALILRRGLWP